MKKVTVSIVRKPGENPYFRVESEGILKHFSFKDDAPPGDIYHKEKNRLAAMELAAKIESNTEPEEEVIYQTPD